MIIHSFDYPPLDGGIARLCFEIATATGGGWNVPMRALSQSIAGGNESGVSPIAEFRVTSRRPWREWEAYRWLRREGKHEAVLCGTWYPEGLLATLAAARPRVVLAHGSELLPPNALAETSMGATATPRIETGRSDRRQQRIHTRTGGTRRAGLSRGRRAPRR